MNKQLTIALIGCTVLIAIYFATSTGSQFQSNSQTNVNMPRVNEVVSQGGRSSTLVNSINVESKPIGTSTRQQLKDEQLTPAETYANWTEVKTLLTKGEINIELEKLLIDSLKKTANPQVYAELKLLLQVPDSNLDSRNQEYLLSLLAAINTKESVSLLLATLEEENVTDSNAIYVAKKSLKKIAQSAAHIDLLENSFNTMFSDNLFLADVANGIAGNATEQSFNFLVVQVDADNEKTPIVLASMSHINNERLVPQLQYLINTREAESELSITSLNTLANMGQYEAAVALIQWSAQQPASSKAFVEELFSTASQRSPSTYRAIEKQLNIQQFTSSEVKQKIEEVYSKK
ncbi:hypothetical protein [Shewanella sp. 125m-1]